MHSDVIMDVVEIVNPLLMATACIDKNIRLISLKEKRIMGIFTGHAKGIRQLDYTPYIDGFMVSVGFEAHAHLWSFEGGMGSI